MSVKKKKNAGRPSSKTPSYKTTTGASKDEDTKSNLIRAAVPLFAKKGLDGTTVKEIADAAGVNVSLVSYYFGGKEALYQSCLRTHGLDKLVLVQKLLRPSETFEQFKMTVRMWIEAVLDDHMEQSEICAMIYQEMDNLMPNSKEIFEETYLKMFSVLVEFIESAKKKKLVRTDLDPSIAAMVLHGSILQIARTEKLRRHFMDLSMENLKFKTKVIDHIITIFFHGLHRGEG